jgi:hypothetical protein
MVKRRIIVLICVLASISVVIPSKAISQRSQTSSSPESIAPYEGEILIYLLPHGQELRNQGMDIGSELHQSKTEPTGLLYVPSIQFKAHKCSRVYYDRILQREQAHRRNLGR